MLESNFVSKLQFLSKRKHKNGSQSRNFSMQDSAFFYSKDFFSGFAAFGFLTGWPKKKGSEILCQKIINNF